MCILFTGGGEGGLASQHVQRSHDSYGLPPGGGLPPGCQPPGGSVSRGVCIQEVGVCIQRGLLPEVVGQTRYGQQAGGTHPTGMHSCLAKILIKTA